MTPLEEFLFVTWNRQIFEYGTGAEACLDMRAAGLEDDVRRFLSDAILRDSASPADWMKRFDVWVATPAAVRKDAIDMWRWLFEDEPPNREP